MTPANLAMGYWGDAMSQTPAPRLSDAARQSSQLLDHWDEAVARKLFDPGCANYPWFRALRERFARAAVNHGHCEPAGPLRTFSRLHGISRLHCERGALELDLSLAPTAHVTMLELREELPADDRMRVLAERVLSALHSAGELEGSLLSSGMNEQRLQRALAHARIDRHECALTAASRGDGHTLAVFGIQCAEGPLELELGLDEAGKIMQLELRATRAANTPCWQ